MAYEQSIFAALSPVASVYPANLPQSYPMPAIRYTVTSGVPFNSLCDPADEQTDEIHIQIDVIGLNHPDTLATMRQARAAVLAMSDPPAVVDDWASPTFDAETKSYIGRLDISLHGSSE